MKYGIISFSAPGSTKKKKLPSFVKPSKPPKVPNGYISRGTADFFHASSCTTRLCTFLASLVVDFHQSTGQGYLKFAWVTYNHSKMKESTDSKSTIFITLLQFFQILPPKITQKFQLLRLATSKTPHGTPRVFVTTVPSSPPPKMVSGVSAVFAKSRLGAISIANWKRHLPTMSWHWGDSLSHDKNAVPTAGYGRYVFPKMWYLRISKDSWM